MSTIIIKWVSDTGDLVPGYGAPKKGDIIIMDEKRAKSFIAQKKAVQYSRRANGKEK